MNKCKYCGKFLSPKAKDVGGAVISDGRGGIERILYHTECMVELYYKIVGKIKIKKLSGKDPNHAPPYKKGYN
jgi:hypothetical protein